MSNNHYGGVIWTNHALERLGERGLSQQYAWQTVTSPDKHFAGKKKGTTEFIKRFGNSTVTVIATQNDNGEWVVLSNWIDPPLPGTRDYFKKEEYRRYRKMGFWGKLWFNVKKQLGF